jgi:ribosomal protein S12 methylthiotransferase
MYKRVLKYICIFYTIGGNKLTKFKIGLISLGCDKNRIDSEIILGGLSQNYEITNNPKEADVIIVNTCGFIETSKQESIDTILEMAEFKTKYNCKMLIATGCMTQRYGKDLIELMPEIDVLMGVNDYDKLHKSIESFMKNHEKEIICTYSDEGVNTGKRIITTGKSSAYIRIGEGCSNFCSYCIIPKIRGKYRSRNMEDILEEVKLLAEAGVKELMVVAQDTTRYGIDLYGEKKLHELIREMSRVEGIKWIRILYCYAEEITDELIEEIRSNDKICKYLDMPIQHISNRILSKMARRGTKEFILNTINKLRERVPEITLRTSLIVGFPGETEEDFNELKAFVEEVKFDKLGVFTYSPEEGTPAASMEDQIDVEVKNLREKEIMLLQQKISAENNASKVGKVYDVIIEGKKRDRFVGRTSTMVPEVDGIVYVNTTLELNNGDIIKVKITESLEYDLIGDVYYESC